MIYILDPKVATADICKTYCHIKPCYGVPPTTI